MKYLLGLSTIPALWVAATVFGILRRRGNTNLVAHNPAAPSRSRYHVLMKTITLGHQIIKGTDIPVSTPFLGRIGAVDGLFLRAFDMIVSLEDPSHTWWCRPGIDLVEVHDYRTVTIDITVR